MIHILGAGLAGTTLAWRFYFNSTQKFRLFHVASAPSASIVAAGLYNSVVFRHIGLGWMANDMLLEAKTFYKRVEKITGSTFFHELPLYRILNDYGQKNDWEVKSKSDLLKSFVLSEPELQTIEKPYGVAAVNGSGYLDVKAYLAASHSFFQSLNVLETISSWSEYEPKTDTRMIYCRGLADKASGPFSYLPFAPVKGEVLDVQIPNKLLPKAIISKQHWIFPVEENIYKLGATYDWNALNYTCTENAKAELHSKGKAMLNEDATIEVINHKAGIRPATKDRKPFLGAHPSIPKTYIFNGLGSKGVLMAPLLSKLLCNFIINSQPLPAEIDILRYAKLLNQ